MAAKRKQRKTTDRGRGRTQRRGTHGRGAAGAHKREREEAGEESRQARVGERVQRAAGNLEGEIAGVRASVEGKVEEARGIVRRGAGKASSLVREAGESAREAGRSALSAARRNPVPLALTGVGAACAGIGVAWLLIGQRRGAGADGSNGQSVAELKSGEEGSPVEQIAASAQRVGRRATDETRELAKRAQSSIGTAAHRVQRAARDARAETQLLGEMAEERFKRHPLVYGAAMVAAGTAIGAALPRSARENRVFGAPRDALVRRARSAAGGAARRLESIAHPSEQRA